MSFIDQEKAFDRVNREMLWEILSLYGVSKHLINLCKSLYTNSSYTVRTSMRYTDHFKIRIGVKQGCVLSPLLFITYIDHITKLANQDEEEINELLFADDQVLIHESKEDLQHHINLLNEIGNQHNMKINIDKTELMAVSRQKQNIDISINGTKLKQTGIQVQWYLDIRMP